MKPVECLSNYFSCSITPEGSVEKITTLQILDVKFRTSSGVLTTILTLFQYFFHHVSSYSSNYNNYKSVSLIYNSETCNFVAKYETMQTSLYI
ncbi:GSCOCG00010153001-RA-CDS [Cotesia congregata]|nr:GSCOCG00010153001-RA-CDS [Cotesia congregata]